MTFSSSAVDTLAPAGDYYASPPAAVHARRAVGRRHTSATTPHKRRANSSVGRSASIRDRTVVVFDWDDTLCPSSWLHAQDLLPKFRGQQIPVSPAQREALAVLGALVERLLRKAVSFGPVFVVTAAEAGWVELSCALYLPQVRPLLELADVHIVSARSWYEQTFGVGGDSGAWKHEVMQLIARKCFALPERLPTDGSKEEEGFFTLLSVGDSMAERDACYAAVDGVAGTWAKTLKFVEHPSADEVAQQVALAHDSFEHMCNWASHLDLRLTREQLAELRA